MPSAFRALEIAVSHTLSRNEWVRDVLDQIFASWHVYEVSDVVIRAFPRVETLGIIDVQHFKQFFDRPVRL